MSYPPGMTQRDHDRAFSNMGPDPDDELRAEEANMTQAKHTPGPWAVEPETLENGKRVATVNGDIVVRTEFPHREWDARLIAAAPDLLDATKLLLARIASGELVRDIRNDNRADWAMGALALVRDLQTVEKAIAKAEGRAT